MAAVCYCSTSFFTFVGKYLYSFITFIGNLEYNIWPINWWQEEILLDKFIWVYYGIILFYFRVHVSFDNIDKGIKSTLLKELFIDWAVNCFGEVAWSILQIDKKTQSCNVAPKSKTFPKAQWLHFQLVRTN